MKQIILLFQIFVLTHNLLGQSAIIDSFLKTYSIDHNFNGTILIQKNGQIQYQNSFGLANQQFNVPNQNETKYKIASITKIFTATLILQLYEQGKIDLNKTIDTYLPNYAGEGANKVAIHQLLNHTSGMVNFDTITSEASAIKNGIPVYQKAMSTDDLLKEYCSDKLVTEPGKVFNYNNAEYIILGKIIEQICSKTFEQVLNDNILKPLKMTNSGMLYQYNIINGLADTYFFRSDLKRLVNDLPSYIENWYASGSMYSTTNDLLKFSNALFGFKILKKETLDVMFKAGLDDYGYSVWVYDSEINNKKYKTIKRPGSIMGAQGQLVHYPSEDLTVIILSNTGTTSLDDFVGEIGKLMIK